MKWTFAFNSNMNDETSVQSMEFSFCYLFKVSCFLSKTCSIKPNTFKRVPSMIRIYRHSELIGVTHNRGKRDREHIPEFCISSLFKQKKEKTMQ